MLRQQAGNIPDIGSAAEEFQFRLADAGAPQDELGIGVQRAARFDGKGSHFREGQDKDFLFPSGEALYIDGNDLAVGDDAEVADGFEFHEDRFLRKQKKFVFAAVRAGLNGGEVVEFYGRSPPYLSE